MPTPVAAPSPVEDFKDALSMLAASVSVLTVDHPWLGGRAVTLTSLVGVSLQPRLMAFFLNPLGMTSALLGVGSRVGISVLGAAQTGLAQRHSARGRGALAFRREHDALEWCGSWVYPGSTAWLAGDVVELRTVGDHRMVVVGVSATRAFGGQPLVYSARTYASLRASAEDGTAAAETANAPQAGPS